MRAPLGQHFLKDKRKIRQIVDALDMKGGDTVIEIGPGTGALTREILGRGISVTYIGIEKDPTLARGLDREFSRHAGSREAGKIVPGDVRTVLPSLIARVTGARVTGYKLVGNIPYYLTGALLRIIGDLLPLPERTVLTVQKEVAERVIAEPPKMNILAASVQFWAEPKIVANIPASAFSPPPDVDSAVLLLLPLPEPSTGSVNNLRKRYYELVHTLFRHPRKTIRNNLISNVQFRELNIEKQLEKAGINPDDRPQDLSRDDILRLAETIRS